jgi:hypothetical protein
VQSPDRLAELLRQRELARQQLAWLDREISAAATPVAKSPDAPDTPDRAPAAELAAAEPDPLASATAARRGCFIYAALALFIAALALVAIYFLAYRGRPLV